MDKAFVSEIIELAWCDKTTFADIKNQHDLLESEVIEIMRKNLKSSSFRLWRKRVTSIPRKLKVR